MVDCITQNRTPLHTQHFNCKITETDNGGCNRSMRREANRLKSYTNWPVKFLKPEQLAKAGFYYTHNGDYVRCAFCNTEVGQWEEGDDPMDDHHRWSYGDCPFLQNRPCGNIPIEEDPTPVMSEGQDTCGKYGIEIRPNSHPERETEACSSQDINFMKLGIQPSRGPTYPQYALLEKRLATFAEWPTSIKQTPKQLAEAGFFYNQKGDQTICFYCGGGLKDWVETDDPWEQHVRWFSKCAFVRLQKGDQYISDVCSRLEAVLSAEEASGLQQASETNDLNGVKVPLQNGTVKSTKANFNIKEQEPSVPAPTVQETHTKEVNPEASKKTTANTLCKICYEKEVGVVFLPCGHIVACIDCAPALSTCAVCRKPLEATVRAFLS